MRLTFRFGLVVALGTVVSLGFADEKKASAPAAVSYYKDIRPIFQAHCQGCHQPAKAKGDFVMTEVARMLAGGESGTPAITPRQPAKSPLVEQITPHDGKAKMPQGKKPLADNEIELIRRWIAQGAIDDTPANAKQRYDQDHPPVYKRPPVITALDYAPDGKLLAVTGFHEVLLIDTETNQRVARLVGLSERTQSVRFSPDGTKLAVAGGLPARMGEIQVWDVAKRKLILSVPVATDTVYGVNWSPDGTKLAFGCADFSIRAIDAKSGEQLLFMGSHTDWVLDTAFSADGSHLASVGRDMTAKLTEVATQRFVDNITSITPGALKGGLQAVTRHPQRDELVLGGSDGVVKVYRMHRLTKRAIGDDANLIRQMPPMTGRVFSVAVSRDGKRIAACSSLDGAGEVDVYSYEFDTRLPNYIQTVNEKVASRRTPEEKAALENYHREGVKLIARTALKQAVYAVAFHPNGQQVAAAGSDGTVRLIDAATGSIVKEFLPAPVAEAAQASPTSPATTVDFVRDVNPILSRLGCNQGTCHGAAQGKNGFKLSLRGYDPIFDVRALADDLGARRVNIASPDDSLMLLKATGAVPHVGSQLIPPTHPYYRVLRDWIAGGAKLDLSAPRVVRITIAPLNPVVERAEQTQAFQVTATYADGKSRDVTHEAFIESGNTEVATAAPRGGLLTAVRRGEAPVLARYEGAYAATILTVMGDRSGFVWQDPPTRGRIDELVAAKWKQLKIQPSGLCTDAEFIRRLSLDLTGLPPTADEVRAFLADKRDSGIKRDELVDRLIGSEAFVDHWTNKWADLLQVNRKFLGPEGAAAFRKWIRDEVAGNTPHDQFVRKVLTASGSNKENPPAAYYKILREPTALMENTTHLFLGVRFNCNRCHDHPFERWNQDQYYETAAYFGRVDLKADPASGGKVIGGTAVEGAKPFYEIVYDKKEGEVDHQRTGQVAPPKFPFPAGKSSTPSQASRREQLADWLTAADNPYFARSFANRLWGYLFGRGIIEPIDDIRAGNPPSNPELLDYLTAEFLKSGFNPRHVLRLICQSRTYQLSVESNRWNEDDKVNYSHALPRRLPAEVLLDSIYRVTGVVAKFPGVPPGTRAAALPDAGVDLSDRFLTTLGRPARESACECERVNTLQLGPVMALINGQTLADALADPSNAIAKLVAQEKDDSKLINELFLRILNRPATPKEIQTGLEAMRVLAEEHEKLAQSLQQREASWAALRPKKEKERDEAIARAKTELAAHEAAIAPKVAEAERLRTARIAQVEEDLKKYETTLPAKQAAWEKQQSTAVDWVFLHPSSLSASNNGAKLTKQPDFSVLASGKNGRGIYTVTARTHLQGITGIRLEALPHAQLPGGGPGRGPGGNFILNELTVQAAPLSAPQKTVKVDLQNPLADFTEQGFKPAELLDGSNSSRNGWAIGPSTGVIHWVTLESKLPFGYDGGTILTFALPQQFDQPNFMLGCFRLSVTTAKPALGRSLAEELKAILVVPAAERDATQQAALRKYFRTIEPGMLQRLKTLADSQKPLPIDPRLLELRAQLAEVSQPLVEDPVLVRLRQDTALSAKQMTNQRLTAAQDVAWALINSAAFLFNR